MRIGIYDLNRSSKLDYKTRLDIYKKNGFKEIGIYLDNKYMYNNENYLNIIKYAKQIGLDIKQVHLDYKNANLICDKTTNEYFDYLKNKIQEALNLNVKYLIVHASKGENAPVIDEIQIRKLKNLMKNFKDKEIYVCFENVRENENLNKILDADINNVAMCYDFGHENCYKNKLNSFDYYLNFIKCVHLSNNFGENDEHNILTDGNLNYKEIIKNLKLIEDCSICLECFPKENNLTENEFLNYVKHCFETIKFY